MIAITGASGFVGSSFLASLRAGSPPCRLLLRRPRGPAAASGHEIVVGDLRDAQARARLVTGAGSLLHLGGLYQGRAENLAQMRAVNVDAAVGLFQEAVRAGVGRIVAVSTAGVHAHAPGIITEQTPLRRQSPDPYEQHKLAMEEGLRIACAGSATQWVVLRPATVYGPGDARLRPLFEMIRRRRFFFIGRGDNRVSWVFIDDLLAALRAALEHPRATGRAYLVSGPQSPTLAELAGCIARILGVPTPRWRLPVAPLLLAARFCELAFPPLGLRPPLYRARLRFFTDSLAYSSERIRAELGVELATPLEVGLSRTLAPGEQGAPA